MFAERIADCITQDEKRYLLQQLSLVLIATAPYNFEWWEWQILFAARRN